MSHITTEYLRNKFKDYLSPITPEVAQRIVANYNQKEKLEKQQKKEAQQRASECCYKPRENPRAEELLRRLEVKMGKRAPDDKTPIFAASWDELPLECPCTRIQQGVERLGKYQGMEEESEEEENLSLDDESDEQPIPLASPNTRRRGKDMWVKWISSGNYKYDKDEHIAQGYGQMPSSAKVSDKDTTMMPSAAKVSGQDVMMKSSGNINDKNEPKSAQVDGPSSSKVSGQDMIMEFKLGGNNNDNSKKKKKHKHKKTKQKPKELKNDNLMQPDQTDFFGFTNVMNVMENATNANKGKKKKKHKSKQSNKQQPTAAATEAANQGGWFNIQKPLPQNKTTKFEWPMDSMMTDLGTEPKNT
ncbi:maker605 [Drosophila busckii]|uniref:Maker605 n=1 Tax=Drosophila busckii TaxID=30019 RepID=A0A0M4EE80_DROBS|nr:uncharacterized protein LOC108595720 [Drosophila busckii]ALC40285.1 maker605 [Drosophila busckii]